MNGMYNVLRLKNSCRTAQTEPQQNSSRDTRSLRG